VPVQYCSVHTTQVVVKFTVVVLYS